MHYDILANWFNIWIGDVLWKQTCDAIFLLWRHDFTIDVYVVKISYAFLSVNCVTKKEEIIIKKKHTKKTCIALYNKAFHNNARNLFSFF
jgi:hypothetical protein